PGPLTVFVDEIDQRFAARTAPRLNIAGDRLSRLDEHIWIKCKTKEVISTITGNQCFFTDTPVVGQTDLVDGMPAGLYWFHSLGHQDSSFDCSACRNNRGPTIRFQAYFFGKLSGNFAEHFWLQFGEVGQETAHTA